MPSTTATATHGVSPPRRLFAAPSSARAKRGGTVTSGSSGPGFKTPTIRSTSELLALGRFQLAAIHFSYRHDSPRP